MHTDLPPSNWPGLQACSDAFWNSMHMRFSPPQLELPFPSLSQRTRAPNETPTYGDFSLECPPPWLSMQQGCCCWLLWDQPWSLLVAMGWRRRGSRRSMLHLLQPSTVPLDILLTAVSISATPLSHQPGLYRDLNYPALFGPSSLDSICLCLYSSAGRRCVPTFVLRPGSTRPPRPTAAAITCQPCVS